MVIAQTVLHAVVDICGNIFCTYMKIHFLYIIMYGCCINACMLDLPTLYLQGGSIIPSSRPYQHVGESNISDDLTLLVALNGNELKSSVVTVKVSKTEGLWKRPSRRLHLYLLLGGSAMLDAWGMDGDAVQITIPSEHDISELVSASEKQYRTRLESAKAIPDVENDAGPKGAELSKTPVELKSGDWSVKIVLWIGVELFLWSIFLQELSGYIAGLMSTVVPSIGLPNVPKHTVLSSKSLKLNPSPVHPWLMESIENFKFHSSILLPTHTPIIPATSVLYEK
ncbi:hypothetical protein LINGRAHAP2_LOCUS5707 [Linum grandiflorum]